MRRAKSHPLGGLAAMACRLLVLSAILSRRACSLLRGAVSTCRRFPLGLHQRFIVGHLADNRGNGGTEQGLKLLALGIGILKRVVQPAGGDQGGVLPVRCLGEQQGDLRQMIDIGFLSVPFAPLRDMSPRGEIGGPRDQNHAAFNRGHCCHSLVPGRHDFCSSDAGVSITAPRACGA